MNLDFLKSTPLKIKSVRLAEVPLTNRQPFRVSTHSTSSGLNVICQLESDGVFGYGAAVPCRLHGETQKTIRAGMEHAAKILSAKQFPNAYSALQWIQSEFVTRASTAAALDIAVWDLMARQTGKSVAALVRPDHPVKNLVITDLSLGMESLEDTVTQVRAAVQRGFTALKFKVGHAVPLQRQILAAIREAAGPTLLLTVDANQGYTVTEALELSQDLKKFGFVLFEQPIAKEDIEGLTKLNAQSAVPIYGDESAANAEQVSTLAEKKAVRGVVIKIFKSRGLTGALDAVEAARHSQLEIMMGCYPLETTLTIAAAAHVAAAFPEIKYHDLDAHLLLSEDPFHVFPVKDREIAIGSLGLGESRNLAGLFK